MEEYYKKYDEVVNVIMTNVLIERERNGKYILHKFDPTNDGHKLYFNITAVAADLNREKIYLDIYLLNYLKFCKKRCKKRSNLRWFSWFQKKKFSDENKISVDTLMNFICTELHLNYRLFKEINDEYYGWVE